MKDQQLLAKQIEITGQAVARITLERQHLPPEEEPPSPILSHGSRDYQHCHLVSRPQVSLSMLDLQVVPHIDIQMVLEVITVLLQRCLVPLLVVLTHVFRSRSVWIISSFAILMKHFGLLLPL